MNSLVELKIVKTGKVQKFSFKQAQEILRIDKLKDFEVADSTKFQFENNELIIQPSPKDGVKSTKSGKRK